MTRSSCERARRIGSLVIDGEGSPAAEQVWTVHTAGCASCRDWFAAAARLRRSLAVTVARDAQAPPQIRDAGPARRLGLRVALCVVAVTQLALSVFELVPGSHDLHETSSAGIAIGVGALLAAWRPSRAGGVVSVVAAFAVLLVGTTVADVGRGEIPAVHELPHLLVLAEAALLALLARGRSPAPRRSGGTRLPLRRAA